MESESTMNDKIEIVAQVHTIILGTVMSAIQLFRIIKGKPDTEPVQ
jgi:hypothetical protein